MTTYAHDRQKRWGRRLLATVSSGAIAAALLASSAQALVTRDDVGPDGAVDVNNEWAGVGQMFNRTPDGTFVCTGQLINPRTIIFAAHCTNDFADADYGATTGGIPIGFGFDPVDTLNGYFGWRDNGLDNGVWASNPDNLFYNVLQIQNVFDGAEPFPGGDIVMGTFDTHIDNLPTYGMLFSPLDGPTHATLVGYGRSGTGSNGDDIGIDFKRRVGENMIDGLYSQNDFIAGVFNVPGADFEDPSAEQLLYHVDFDRPDRNANDCARGEFFGFGFGNDIVCNTGPFGGNQPLTWDETSGILTGDHIDYYPGDALAFESGTAGGDSGGGLFADDIYYRPLVTGVLSGGWVNGFFSPNGGYGDVSYYNPLFLYRDWIVENNPYVYASARHGSGAWSDANHWVQNMDPNYFYIDRFGRVRNGLPAQPEPGYDADRPKWGTVFDLSIPDDVEGTTGAEAAVPSSSPAIDTIDFRGVLDEPAHGGPYGHGGGGGSGPTASNGDPTGPGSRGFVPNNDWGAYGAWSGGSDGVARFYDVTLNNIGTTRLDVNVEIDRLSVEGRWSRLKVQSNYQLNSLIAVDQYRGFVEVDGTVETREYALWGGFLSGYGAINAQTVYNINGVISAGRHTSVGSMTINGDYVQSSIADMVVNIRRHGHHVTNDFIQVNGAASLDGNVLIAPVNFSSRPRWRDVYTVLNADEVTGNFDNVDLFFSSPVLYGDSVVQADGDVDVVVKARRLGHIFGHGHSYHSLGNALDNLRWSDNFANFGEVFDLVDSSSFETFDSTLFSLTPTGAFTQTASVSAFNNSFAGHIAQRGAELRAGKRGVSATGLRGAFGSLAPAGPGMPIAQGLRSEEEAASPMQLGDRLGVFISSRGSFDEAPMGADRGYGFDPFANITDVQSGQGDLAIGADYRVTDNLAIGLALTTSRYEMTTNGFTPLSNDSVGATAYATAFGEGWYVDGYYGASHQDFEMERLTSNVTGDMSIAFGAPEGKQALAGVRSGWTFTPARGLTIGPVASLNYSQLTLSSYFESAAGEFNLVVDERDLTSVTAEAGAEFRFNHVTNGGKMFTAFGEFSAAREIGRAHV